jgi:microcystin-dependent protein
VTPDDATRERLGDLERNVARATRSSGIPYVTALPDTGLRGQIVYVAAADPANDSLYQHNGTSWAPTGGPAGGAMPAGALAPYAGAAAPTGWLLCAGQSLLRTDYPTLFAAIGTAYGAADATHFTLPDLRGRVPVGMDNMGGSDAGLLTTANTLGATVGAQTHTLTATEMPTHNHDVGYTQAADAATTGTGQRSNLNGSVSSKVTSNAGGGGAHNNMQPSIILNYIIKT